MDDIRLPPLPKLPPMFKRGTIGADACQEYAREYALKAVERERERCAKLAEQTKCITGTPRLIAAAIRHP